MWTGNIKDDRGFSTELGGKWNNMGHGKKGMTLVSKREKSHLEALLCTGLHIAF